MRKKISIIFLILILNLGYSTEFQWYRAKVGLLKPVPDGWDAGMDYDLEFLEALEKYTTLKVNKKVNVTTFEDIEKISQYPIVFMTSEGDIKFSDIEIKNMREYCNRGGFLFVDDCVYKGRGDYFFRSFKNLVETKIFPGKKMELLPLDHEIYHCHFDLTKGLPYIDGEGGQGVPHGGYGLSDDKGNLVIFLSAHDIHCGWSSKLHQLFPNKFTSAKREECIKMAINIVIYALTH